MRLSVFPSARATLIAALVASLSTAACVGSATGTGANAPQAEGTVIPKEVPDPEFAAGVHRLLRDGNASSERLSLLVGVVRRQLAHAEKRFRTGHAAEATASVIGALYLVRAGEGRKEMIDATGERALAGAIDRVSPRGDEGRALALMKLRIAALDPSSPQKAEIDQHLAALNAWMVDTRTGGMMRRLGAEERAKVARALLDPSTDVLEDAAIAVDAWIAQAIKYNDEFRQSGKRPEREEAVEASRALESGGATLAALFLRHGDAMGALDHIDRTSAKRVIQPGLYARIRGAAVSEDPKSHDWLALAGAFAHQRPEDSDPETDIDPEVLSAGLWGAAIEAYRKEPTSFDACVLVARSLVQFGMPEAAPLVMAEGLASRATPATISAAMGLLLDAITSSARQDDLETARRTYTAAAAILTATERPELRGHVDPATSQLRFVMAAIEVRAGNLAQARSLLKAAIADDPSVSAFTTLALVERQAGDAKAAIDALEQGQRAADARVSLLDVAEARLVAFELFRDGATAGASKASLDAALGAVLSARQAASGPAAKSRAERLLGRILEGYGDSAGAARAFDRGLSIAAADKSALGAVMLDAVGRALVRRDLPAARGALKRGLDADANEDDLVYGGLWVLLLERDLHAAPDGTATLALRGTTKGGWTAKLAAWATGRLSDTDLGAAAQSASQRVEAAFYTALGRKAAGDPGADQRLRAVAASPVIDLLEVQLAREMFAPRGRADLPLGVKLP